jgi:hypothetical protein
MRQRDLQSPCQVRGNLPVSSTERSAKSSPPIDDVIHMESFTSRAEGHHSVHPRGSMPQPNAVIVEGLPSSVPPVGTAENLGFGYSVNGTAGRFLDAIICLTFPPGQPIIAIVGPTTTGLPGCWFSPR